MEDHGPKLVGHALVHHGTVAVAFHMGFVALITTPAHHTDLQKAMHEQNLSRIRSCFDMLTLS